jgi:hypothetical protein
VYIVYAGKNVNAIAWSLVGVGFCGKKADGILYIK